MVVPKISYLIFVNIAFDTKSLIHKGLSILYPLDISLNVKIHV